MSLCPCGSGISYRDCCGPLHQGKPAPTPEALMRSRYSAFVRQDSDYLLSSWAAQTRPSQLTLDDDRQWCALLVNSSSQQGREGRVSFCARFRDQDGYHELAETSRFQLDEDGYWRYLDGKADIRRWAPGRNDPCPCGSGKKFKKCCG
ncbi:MAG: zinc chelation protein SecC [Oceanospirillaceae bacterium]|nr:zinc chelation protein SecC [Oceanospirillaceae bacterium]MBT11613.1 zinc chelation protein SecC [Oceanospirillaceae bacterium]